MIITVDEVLSREEESDLNTREVDLNINHIVHMTDVTDSVKLHEKAQTHISLVTGLPFQVTQSRIELRTLIYQAQVETMQISGSDLISSINADDGYRDRRRRELEAHVCNNDDGSWT